MENVTNIIVAGLGGQGVLKASDIAAEVFFRAGHDVKKSELHGMSQRGGSVSSDIRFGRKVLSPMVPAGEADFLLVLDETQVELNRPNLRPGGTLIAPDAVDMAKLDSAKSLNVALLGVLSRNFDIPPEAWMDAICQSLPDKLHAMNRAAFLAGRG